MSTKGYGQKSNYNKEKSPTLIMDRENVEFCSSLKKMLADEAQAGAGYGALKPSHPLSKAIIESIQTDEQKHHRLLEKIVEAKC